MNATAAHPSIVCDFNVAGGRYIEEQKRNKWSCFTFKRKSDETYSFVRTDVTEAAARHWLEHGDFPPPRQRRQRTLKLDTELTAAEAEELRGLLRERPGSSMARKVLAAL